VEAAAARLRAHGLVPVADARPGPPPTRAPLLELDGVGHRYPDGRVALASDPAHKLVNPVLYRIEEAAACWDKVAAPVLWVSGSETAIPKQLKLSDAELAARKARFRRLTERVIPGAGHMLHHDQPERLAEVIEEFLR